MAGGIKYRNACRRTLFCLVTVLVFATAGVAQREPPSVTQAATKLVGTEWVGLDGPDRHIITFRFEPGGLLVYHYGGTTYRNGTWKQTGLALYLEMNNKYREFNGIVSDETITGDSWNVVKQKWTTTMYKYTKPSQNSPAKPALPKSRKGTPTIKH